MKALLLAGEPSGDRYAAEIARALREQAPGIELRAMGGHFLREAGVPLEVDSTDLAVVGLTEVLGRAPALLRAYLRLRRVIDGWRPDVLVPVDYPDFNLRVSAHARSRGVRVAYFISPQVWAWRPGRVASIGRAVSRMLVIFPFEAETYARAGIPVQHVGHPLVERGAEFPSRGEARSSLGVAADARVLALLPGSREGEVRRHWPVLAEAAALLEARSPGREILVPLARGLSEDVIEPRPAGLRLRVERDAARAVLAASDVAAVASGTATLEAALAGTPLVAVYRVSALTMALSRQLADREFLARGLFALPNVVLGRAAVPELYQERLSAEALASELERLERPEVASAVRTDLARLRGALGGPGAFARTAAAILDVARGA